VTNTAQPQPDSFTRLIVAMAELGAASAADLAQAAGMGYSTTTPKLRALETDGRAQKVRTQDRGILWQLAPNRQPTQATSTDGEQVDGELPATEPEPAADAADAMTNVDAADDSVGDTSAEDVQPARPQPVAAVRNEVTEGSEVASQPGTEHPASGPAVDPATGSEPDTGANAADQVDEVDAAAEELEPEPEAVVGDGVPERSGAASLSAPERSGPGTGADHETTTGGDADAAPVVSSVEVATPDTGPAAKKPRRTRERPRRRKGQLRDEVLAILQKEPDHSFGATALSQRLDGASQGAIANALDKLVSDGSVQLAQDKPARWQAV